MEEAGFEDLIGFITTTLGIDGSSFNPKYLRRRIQTRMSALGTRDLPTYGRLVRQNPHEQEALRQALTIHLSSFFRDASMWDALRKQVLPQLLPPKGRRFPLRCWSAGCASGEETYSLAMLLAERMERAPPGQRVAVLGTDAETDVLARARTATYSKDAVAGIPKALGLRFLDSAREPGADRFVVKDPVRRLVKFLRHDLATGRPPALFDLVLCRNVIIYFTKEMHAETFDTLQQSLKASGILVLGKTELLGRGHRSLFEPVNVTERIYQKISSRTASA